MSSDASSSDAPSGNASNAGSRVIPSRAAWMLDAGLVAFAATTGALLAFAYARGWALAPFAQVGRRVAREIALPAWGDAVLGLLVHLGQCLALGALSVLLMAVWGASSRLRSALVVALAWQLVAMVPWFAVIRADIAIGLSTVARVGLAALLVAALTLAPRRV